MGIALAGSPFGAGKCIQPDPRYFRIARKVIGFGDVFSCRFAGYPSQLRMIGQQRLQLES